MHLKLERETSANGWTLGNLFIDGVWECFVCEDVVREIPGKPASSWKIPGKTAIPTGTYDVIWDYSNRFKRTTLHLLGVDGFEGIRVHSGNVAADTEGCLLPGQTKNANGVFRSVLALDALRGKVYPALDAGETVTITIS